MRATAGGMHARLSIASHARAAHIRHLRPAGPPMQRNRKFHASRGDGVVGRTRSKSTALRNLAVPRSEQRPMPSDNPTVTAGGPLTSGG